MAPTRTHVTSRRRRPADLPGPPDPPGVAVALALALAVSLALGACGSPTPIPPVAPARDAATPEVLVGGVVPATLGPGDAPTARPVATAATPPPEPLRVPGKFAVSVFAEGLAGIRMLAVAPNGDLFASLPRADQVLVLPDRDGDGRADAVHVFARGGDLNQPNGLGFSDGSLYVASTDTLTRWPYAPGDLAATGAPAVLATLPGEGLHPLHSLAIGLGGEVYVGIGSSCDACVESDERRASVMRFAPDGSTAELFATGLRNPAGIAVHPQTGGIWATDSGREGLGQALPLEELNLLTAGAPFGWPHCYGDRQPDYSMAGSEPLCAGTVAPVVGFIAHSSPIGAAFYSDTRFPAPYPGGLFVALHGTYDQYLPTGTSIVFLPFSQGYPTGEVQGFVEGWLMPDSRRWAMPVDIVTAPDGSLLVSDEGGGRIYRVFYFGPPATPTPIP